MSDLIGRIEAAIKEKGLTFNRVEHDCGLGNGTIKRWQDQSPRLDKLIVVAGYLNVSLDYLVFGSLKSEKSCDGIPLSDDEQDIIAMYRILDDTNRETVVDMVTMLYEKATGKRASIYSTYTDEEKQHKSGPDDDGKPCIGTA